jgi:hypothetical protein
MWRLRQHILYQFGFSDQDNVSVRMRLNKMNGRRHGNRDAAIPAHAINSDIDGHLSFVDGFVTESLT